MHHTHGRLHWIQEGLNRESNNRCCTVSIIGEKSNLSGLSPSTVADHAQLKYDDLIPIRNLGGKIRYSPPKAIFQQGLRPLYRSTKAAKWRMGRENLPMVSQETRRPQNPVPGMPRSELTITESSYAAFRHCAP